MNAANIITHLFGAHSLEEVPRERLEEMVTAYPSFGIARYLLSRKLRSENAAHFPEEIQKTNLYFTNPLWLHWLLQEEAVPTVETIQPDELAPVAEVVQLPEEIIQSEVHTQPEEVIQPGEIIQPEEVTPYEEQVNVPGIPEPAIRESEFHEAEASVSPAEEPAPIEETRPIEVPEQPVPQEAETVLAASIEANPVEPIEDKPVTAPAPPEPLPLIFESYHTIDYFASQGIKLTLEEHPQDKLGKQLKSFTEWLKTMRRLPQREQEIVPDLADEHKIKSIAAHSIESREILTETMAEVLAKQGMYDKAAEVYRKLSLLNPGKSAYFARKIEDLTTD